MNQVDVTMVRVYLAEGRDDVGQVLKWIGKSEVRGFTVFRGVAGKGTDGQVHKASLLDLSSALPIVIEFFDEPERVQEIVEALQKMVKADHIVSWPAKSGK